MKTQYRYTEHGLRYHIELYHDGELFSFYKVWCDEAHDEIDRLKAAGYVRGWTKAEVEEQHAKYLEMLDMIIEVR